MYAITVSLQLTAFSLNKCIKHIWFENEHIGILMVFLFKAYRCVYHQRIFTLRFTVGAGITAKSRIEYIIDRIQSIPTIKLFYRKGFILIILALVISKPKTKSGNMLLSIDILKWKRGRCKSQHQGDFPFLPPSQNRIIMIF